MSAGKKIRLFFRAEWMLLLIYTETAKKCKNNNKQNTNKFYFTPDLQIINCNTMKKKQK